MIGDAFFGSVDMRKILEVEAFGQEFFFGMLAGFFPFGDKVEDDPPVFTKDIVQLFHKGRAVAVQRIVVVAAAIVVAKLFVDAAFEGFAAGKTVSGIGVHSQQVSKILPVCKRL